MEPIWLAVAFVGGLIARTVGLPPLIGFLLAGVGMQFFAGNVVGVSVAEGGWIAQISSLGVQLLLFTLGIKISLKQLAAKAVWLGGSTAMLASVLIASALMWLAGLVGVSIFHLPVSTLLLIGFALSFSSTVLVSAVLQSKGELDAEHGKLAIGILVIQDIAAVVFLVASKGELPSEWAFALLLLPLARPVIYKIFDQSGHDEMLLLFGFLTALGIGWLFDAVGLKADLGALCAGLLINTHPRANELAKSLLQFKDLFLIGFFIEVGVNMQIEPAAFIAAALFIPLLVAKPFIYFFSTIGFNLRARTATLNALALTNYSEFGLIVAVVAVKAGWLEPIWLSVLAISLVGSFVISTEVNKRAHYYWRTRKKKLVKYENKKAKWQYPLYKFKNTDIIIFGMGRVGKGAYDYIATHDCGRVAGVDVNAKIVSKLKEEGRRVYQADANDQDFWERVSHDHVDTIMIALPNHKEIVSIVKLIKATKFKGKVAAIGRYDDEVGRLRELGVDAAFNIYNEAGAGFAEHVSEELTHLGAKH